MDNNNSFSKRNNFEVIQPKEITVRNDAPNSLRDLLISFANENSSYTMDNKQLDTKEYRDLINSELGKSNNPNSWSKVNLYSEIYHLLTGCNWFKVYDVIEKLYLKVSYEKKDSFTEEINNHFINNGIGWKLEEGKVVYRGDSSFEQITKSNLEQLDISETEKSAKEFKEAFACLSRRPEPDLIGAVTRAMSGLECLIKRIENSNLTLGKLIQDQTNIKEPLKTGVEKLWAFAQSARHPKELNELNYQETELLVSISSAVATYLHKLTFPNSEIKKNKSYLEDDDEDDVPF